MAVGRNIGFRERQSDAPHLFEEAVEILSCLACAAQPAPRYKRIIMKVTRQSRCLFRSRLYPR